MPNTTSLYMCIIYSLYIFMVFVIVDDNIKNLRNVENKIKIVKYRKIKNFILSLFIILVFFIVGVFSYVPAAVHDNKMASTINFGDEIIYKKIIDASSLKQDDIIIYLHNNEILIRRIRSISLIEDKHYIIVMQDNGNYVEYNSVDENRIIGIYKFKIPYVGYPIALFKKIIGGILHG